MKPNLKNLSEQVVVITGPTSGIGLVTARLAAKRGARLVLAARTQVRCANWSKKFARAAEKLNTSLPTSVTRNR